MQSEQLTKSSENSLFHVEMMTAKEKCKSLTEVENTNSDWKQGAGAVKQQRTEICYLEQIKFELKPYTKTIHACAFTISNLSLPAIFLLVPSTNDLVNMNIKKSL